MGCGEASSLSLNMAENLRFHNLFSIFASQRVIVTMGRNKFSDAEIKDIAKLLRLKNAGNRAKQKLVRHDLRTLFEFNISDFNVLGKAFGEAELYEAIDRCAIQILDDATIADMKAKRARDKERDKAEAERRAIEAGEMTDWRKAMAEWES